MATFRHRRGVARLLLLCLVVAGCGDPGAATNASGTASHAPFSTTVGGTAAPTSAAATPTSRPAATAGPASLAVDVVGDGDLTGQLDLAGSQGTQLRCAVPGFDGLQIEAFVPTSVPAVTLHLVVSQSTGAPTLSVGVATTTTPPSVRTFTGTGVSAFDPAHGATFDTTLTEQSPTGSATVGAISSIKGSIDCGNATPGTSTLAISRSGVPGLDGPIGSASVACLGSTRGLSVIGMAGPAGSPAFRIVMGITPTLLTVAVQPPDLSPPTVYLATVASALSGATGTVDADVTTTATSGAGRSPTGTLHVAGQATCGNVGA